MHREHTYQFLSDSCYLDCGKIPVSSGCLTWPHNFCLQSSTILFFPFLLTGDTVFLYAGPFGSAYSFFSSVLSHPYKHRLKSVENKYYYYCKSSLRSILHLLLVFFGVDNYINDHEIIRIWCIHLRKVRQGNSID